MYRKKAITQSQDVRETAIAYHAGTTATVVLSPFPFPFPAPSPQPSPPSDQTASTAPDKVSTPAPGRVWWYVLHEELARRDATIDTLAERVECLERERCRQRDPPWERGRYFE